MMSVQVLSYNCGGLRLEQGIKLDISLWTVCLQNGTFYVCKRHGYLKKTWKNLTTFPKFDVSTAIVKDRIAGCVTVLWGKEK